MHPRSRAVYPVALSITALVAGGWHLHVFLSRVLPQLAPVVEQSGEAFPQSVRATIVLFGGSAAWLYGALPLGLLAAVGIGLLWKPEKPWGPNLLLTLCVVALLLIQVVLLAALSQTAAILPCLGPPLG